MEVRSLGKPSEPVKPIPVKTVSTSEARVTLASTAMKPEGSKGASLASKAIELIILPGEEENANEGEEKAEEEEKEGSPEQTAMLEIRNALPFERHTSSIAAEVNGIYARVFFSTAGERAILTQAVASNILSNIRHDKREAADKALRQQEKKKEEVREDIKNDAKHYDQSQETIRADQVRLSIERNAAKRGKAISTESTAYGVSQKKGKANEPASPPNPR